MPNRLKDHTDEINQMLLEMVEVGKRHGIHFPRDFALHQTTVIFWPFYENFAPEMDMFHDARLKWHKHAMN